MSLESIYTKLTTGDPNRNLDPFPLNSLPTDRNDLLWETLRTNYQLSLEELSLLKSSRFDQLPPLTPPPVPLLPLLPPQPALPLLQPPQPVTGSSSSSSSSSSCHYEFGPVVDDRKNNKKRSRSRKDDVDEDGERKKPRSKVELLQQNFDRIKEALLKFKELKGHMLVPYEFRIPLNDPNWKADQGDLWLGKVCRNIRAGHCYAQWKEELMSLGFDYTKQSKGDWSRLRDALIRYKELKGDIKITYSFEVPSSNEWPEEMWGLKLGKAVRNIKAGTHYRDHREEVEAIGVVMGAEQQRPQRASGKNKSSSSGSTAGGVAGLGLIAQGPGLGVSHHDVGYMIPSAPHNLLMPPMVEMQGMEPMAMGMKGPAVDVKDLLRHGTTMGMGMNAGIGMPISTTMVMQPPHPHQPLPITTSSSSSGSDVGMMYKPLDVYSHANIAPPAPAVAEAYVPVPYVTSSSSSLLLESSSSLLPLSAVSSSSSLLPSSSSSSTAASAIAIAVAPSSLSSSASIPIAEAIPESTTSFPV